MLNSWCLFTWPFKLLWTREAFPGWTLASSKLHPCWLPSLLPGKHPAHQQAHTLQGEAQLSQRFMVQCSCSRGAPVQRAAGWLVDAGVLHWGALLTLAAFWSLAGRSLPGEVVAGRRDFIFRTGNLLCAQFQGEAEARGVGELSPLPSSERAEIE